MLTVNSMYKMIYNKYHNLSLSRKATIWYSLCNILQKGIAFIVIPIYVRVLSTTEYGNYMAFQAWRDILIIVASLNLYCGVYTKAMVDYVEDRDRYTSVMQGLGTTITGIFFIIYCLFPKAFRSIFEMDCITIFLLFIYFITYPAISFWSVRQRVEYKYKQMVIITLLLSLLTPMVSVWLLFNTNLQERAVIYGFLVVQILFGLYFYIYHFYKGKKFYIKDYWFYALKFNIPLIPHYLSLIILGQVDRIMIKNMDSAANAGIYSLAYQVSMIMTIFTSAINSSLIPWVYSKLKIKEYKQIEQASNQVCVFVAASLLLLMLIGPEIINIIGTEDYKSALWVIPAVAASLYFQFVYGLFSNIEFYYGATVFVMIASVSIAIVKIILNSIFIPLFGFLSAGYTTLICYFLFMLLHFIFMRIIMKRESIIRIFDIKFIMKSILFLLISMSLCLYSYDYIYVRLLCICFIIITVLKNKQLLCKIFKIS